MFNLAFTRRGTGISNRSRWATTTLIAGLGLALSVACGPVAVKDIQTSSTTSLAAQDRETVRGHFVVVFGDPPPDSGRPAQRRYTLTDQQGQRWTLTFDESVYTPPGGILSYNGKQVEVEGRLTGANRLLVESMRLL